MESFRAGKPAGGARGERAGKWGASPSRIGAPRSPWLMLGLCFCSGCSCSNFICFLKAWPEILKVSCSGEHVPLVRGRARSCRCVSPRILGPRGCCTVRTPAHIEAPAAAPSTCPQPPGPRQRIKSWLRAVIKNIWEGKCSGVNQQRDAGVKMLSAAGASVQSSRGGNNLQ